MTEGNHGKNPNQFGQQRDLNLELSEYESSAMNFDQSYALCIQKTLSQTALHRRRELEYEPPPSTAATMLCETSGSPASSCVMRRHYSITYMESLHAINGLPAVGRFGNLICGRPSYFELTGIELF